jgi:hypothetical protein
MLLDMTLFGVLAVLLTLVTLFGPWWAIVFASIVIVCVVMFTLHLCF